MITSPAFFAFATIACLLISLAGRFLILWWAGWYNNVMLTYAGAFRKRAWRYLGVVLTWDSYHRHDTGVSNVVVGFYPLNWQLYRHPRPDEFGFTGWAFGPLAFSRARYV